jgi:ABC-type oligopeptide transport system substrate-binding subunit
MYQGRLINTASSALSPYYDSRLDKNIFSSSSPFDTVKNLYQTRTQQARGLNALKDAGFQYNQGELSKNGRKITVNVLLDSNDEKQVSQMDVIKKQLTPLGFNFQVSQSSSQEYERRLQNFEYDMAFVKKEFDITSRRSFESFFNNGGANNYSRLNSSQLQNSVNDLDNAQTLEQYKYQIKVLDKIVLFEYIFLPLTQENIKTIYSNKPIRCPQNISGFKISLCIIS